MNRFPILSVLFVCCLWSPLRAQVPGAGGAAARPALDQLVTDYEAQEKAIDDEIEPQLKAARDRYSADLQAFANKYNQARRPDEADKFKHEIKRFEERGMNGEPAKSAPAEVRSAWANLLKSTATTSQSVALKRNTARSKFLQSLTPVEQDFRAKNDAEGAASARRARAAVSIRAAVEAGRVAVTDLAGKGEGWQDIAREGGYIVGFEAGKGGWFQFSVLGGLRPIFATAHGERPGERRGKASGKRVVAKDGYAVGGLQVRSGDVVNCVEIIFMRINPDGISLNPQDTYVTDWLGGEGGGKPREINPRGRMIVGVTGSTGDVVNSLGLVYLR